MHGKAAFAPYPEVAPAVFEHVENGTVIAVHASCRSQFQFALRQAAAGHLLQAPAHGSHKDAALTVDAGLHHVTRQQRGSVAGHVLVGIELDVGSFRELLREGDQPVRGRHDDDAVRCLSDSAHLEIVLHGILTELIADMYEPLAVHQADALLEGAYPQTVLPVFVYIVYLVAGQ